MTSASGARFHADGRGHRRSASKISRSSGTAGPSAASADAIAASAIAAFQPMAGICHWSALARPIEREPPRLSGSIRPDNDLVDLQPDSETRSRMKPI
ncbi:MAG TPA: hypothetical protein VF516_33280 [Kofleriaceae bacterium]